MAIPVGMGRLHQIRDIELGIRQALMEYKRLRYSDN